MLMWEELSSVDEDQLVWSITPLESIWFSRFMRSLTIEGWFLFTFRQFCG